MEVTPLIGPTNGATHGPLPWLVTLTAGLLLVAFLLKQISGGKRVPGPWLSIPVLGQTLEMKLSDPAHFVWSRYQRYGRVFRVSLLGLDTVLVADLAALRPLLSDQGGLFTLPVPSFTSLMGSYVIQDKLQLHGPWRKLFLAAASGGGLKALLPQIKDIMEEHVRQWESQGRVEIFQAARRLGLDLGIAITGVDLEGKGLDMGWFKEQMSVFLAGLFGLPLALPGSQLAKALAAKERLLDALEPVVKARHDAFHAEWQDCGADFAAAVERMYESARPVTISNVQMLGFHGLGAQEVRDSAMSILHSVMAAADTTRFSLLNTWALLAQLPAVQDKIYEEQKKVMAEFGPEVGFRALTSMPYLEAVFKEAMRVLPSTSGGFRRLTRDLTVGDVTLPAGTVVWYPTLLLHMLDPVLWDGDTRCALPRHMDWRNNLEGVFQPERWLGDEAKRPRSFYAFGSGAHQCAGMQLVLMEIKLLLARIMRRHRLALEVPDMLHRANLFPFITPVKGTDGVRLLPREDPLPWE